MRILEIICAGGDLCIAFEAAWPLLLTDSAKRDQRLPEFADFAS
jgi:hypothetical protein